MRAKCGRCGTDFAVAGPGRYQCPTCGTLNEVKGTTPGVSDMPGSSAPPPGGPMGEPPPGVPPPPEIPSDRASCPACSFTFIVGSVADAECPMCGEDVHVGNPASE